MTIQDEQKILENVYGNILSVKKEMEKYLSKVEDDTLSQEMNLFLYHLKPFEKKAESRMQRKERVPVEVDALPETITQERIVRNFIDYQSQAAKKLKYAIHEYKGAGIYATELAKELIDFEESAAGKFKDYLV